MDHGQRPSREPSAAYSHPPLRRRALMTPERFYSDSAASRSVAVTSRPFAMTDGVGEKTQPFTWERGRATFWTTSKGSSTPSTTERSWSDRRTITTASKSHDLKGDVTLEPTGRP